MTAATAELYDESLKRGRPPAVCDIQLRNFGKLRAFHGRIATVRCLDDNSQVRPVLEAPGAGRVLVLDGGGSLRTALLGDILGGLAAANGWAGVVVNGAVRDVAGLAGLEVGVKALGTTPRKSGKGGKGETDVPVTFGGITFTPGHWLYADEDGILVSPTPLPPG